MLSYNYKILQKQNKNETRTDYCFNPFTTKDIVFGGALVSELVPEIYEIRLQKKVSCQCISTRISTRDL